VTSRSAATDVGEHARAVRAELDRQVAVRSTHRQPGPARPRDQQARSQRFGAIEPIRGIRVKAPSRGRCLVTPQEARQWRGDGRQRDRLAGERLLVGDGEVLRKDLHRHRVADQVMGDDRDPGRRARAVDELE
jgi:hypothetical protein